MAKLKDKNILVTGGTGFIGAHLVEELLEQKAQVITTYQSLHPKSYFLRKKLNKEVTMLNLDINEYESVIDALIKHDIEYIFHLAAQPLVEVAYYNPKQTLHTNIIGTVNILEASRNDPKIKGVIIASSDKAYGKDSRPYKESMPLKGDHPYEVSKSSADLIAQSYFVTYNVPVVITRFGNVYGEGDLHWDRIIPGICRAIAQQKKLEIRSDGTFVRDYIHVKDVVQGYILLLNKFSETVGKAFNFSSRESYSVLALIKEIEKIVGKKIPYKILNTAKNEITYQHLDDKRIRALGWKNKFTLQKTFVDICKWYGSIL